MEKREVEERGGIAEKRVNTGGLNRGGPMLKGR
jgi:hypothetical protein